MKKSTSTATTASARNNNKRLMPKSPSCMADKGNQQLNQFFSKKVNQSASPSRRLPTQSSDKPAGELEGNFFDPLKDTDMEEAEEETESQNHQSNEDASSESSGIIHAVTQQNNSNTQTLDAEAQGDNLGQNSQEQQPTQTSTVETNQRQHIDDHSQKDLVENKNNTSHSTLQVPSVRIPQNPYRRPTAGRGGGMNRNATLNPTNPFRTHLELLAL
jgi:hypothetical protein